MLVEQNTVMVEEREREIRQIVQSISDLNEIFRDLAGMVVEQVFEALLIFWPMEFNKYIHVYVYRMKVIEVSSFNFKADPGLERASLGHTYLCLI